jgi:hypothetical protein
VKKAAETLSSIPTAVPIAKEKLAQLNGVLSQLDVGVREVETLSKSFPDCNDIARIPQTRLLLDTTRKSTSQRLTDATKTFDLLEKYGKAARAAEQLMSSEERKIQTLCRKDVMNMRAKILQQSESLWKELTNACKGVSLTIPGDLGKLAFSALDGRFKSFLDSVTKRESFDQLCSETLKRATELDLNSLRLSREKIDSSWKAIVKQKLDGQTHHKCPDVMIQLDQIEIELLRKNYLQSARQARDILDRALMMRLARLVMIAEAQVMTRPGDTDPLTQPVNNWQEIQRKCDETHQATPQIEDDLKLETLRGLQREIMDWRVPQSDQRIVEYATLIHESEIVAQERIKQGIEICHDLMTLNPDIAEGSKAQTRHYDPAAIMNSLIPNLSVQQSVHRVRAATIEELENTRKLLSTTSFTLDATNVNAPFHVFAALMPSPSPEVLADAWNKSADFALENDVICESSMFLLGSTCPEHQAKALTLHLRGDLAVLESDPRAKAEFLQNLKVKLGQIYSVSRMKLLSLLLDLDQSRRKISLRQM